MIYSGKLANGNEGNNAVLRASLIACKMVLRALNAPVALIT
jgi:hypothetical protein